MFQIVTLQLCGVLTVQFGCRSCCWPTALSLWTALLCLLCRVDTFMFITQTLDFQPVSYTCKMFLLIIIPYHDFFTLEYPSFLTHWLIFACLFVLCHYPPNQDLAGESNAPAGGFRNILHLKSLLFTLLQKRNICLFNSFLFIVPNKGSSTLKSNLKISLNTLLSVMIISRFINTKQTHRVYHLSN